MEFTSVPTELTTAATDALLSAMAIGLVLWIGRCCEHGTRRRIWNALLILLAAGAALGAVVHGLEWSAGARSRLWDGIFLTLSGAAALFPLAAVHDLAGPTAARRWAPGLLVAAGSAFVASRVSANGLTVLLVVAGVAAVASLTAYLVLWTRTREVGFLAIAGGLAANLIASAVQASGTARMTIVWPFDHNGICHLIQAVGLGILGWGVVRSCRGPRPPA